MSKTPFILAMAVMLTAASPVALAHDSRPQYRHYPPVHAYHHQWRAPYRSVRYYSSPYAHASHVHHYQGCGHSVYYPPQYRLSLGVSGQRYWLGWHSGW